MSAGDIGTNLRTYLLSRSEVTSLLGTSSQIFSDELPQRNASGFVLPAIVYNLITGEHQQHLQGSAAFSATTIQYDCWALSRDEANALAEALRTVLTGFRGMAGDDKVDQVLQGHVRFDYEPPQDASEGGLYRHSRDYEVLHDEPLTV